VTDPDWLLVAAAAREHGVSERTLRRWATTGLVAYVRGRYRDIFVNRASLEARLADRPRPGPKRKEAAR
jgi:predicted site-specific integrase-resolvase